MRALHLLEGRGGEARRVEVSVTGSIGRREGGSRAVRACLAGYLFYLFKEPYSLEDANSPSLTDCDTTQRTSD